MDGAHYSLTGAARASHCTPFIAHSQEVRQIRTVIFMMKHAYTKLTAHAEEKLMLDTDGVAHKHFETTGLTHFKM